ncbi:hypothetical protein DF185_03950 [Marinifilum breve]|uniref:Peptidase S74 domain-containing protein n=1 Tax=Marinifilum breve TaxID=2184082 RepID=A0A2V4A396_9BACT|nr:hypothetical protein [Marinifilum breve]PXY01810.1 hypothetical protein DF185_03950 [Marinifilum breve]
MIKTIISIGLTFCCTCVFSQNGQVKTTTGTADDFHYKDGKVGIGTSSPSSRLQIYSNPRTGVTTNCLSFGSNSADLSSVFKVKNHGGYRYSLSIGTYWGTDRSNEVPNMMTFKNRSIGIGVDNPTGGLQIYSNAATGKSTNCIVLGSSAEDLSSVFKVKNHGEYRYSLSIGTYWGDKKGTIVDDVFTIKNSKIGILNSDPFYALDINGTLRAEEIKVEANGKTADFVFEEDYQLKPLSEVEQFVKNKKHLPEIPSAKQMEKTGLNIAEMNAKLLQKIEELTLYLIDQNKQLQRQSNEIQQLKAEIIKLKK